MFAIVPSATRIMFEGPTQPQHKVPSSIRRLSVCCYGIDEASDRNGGPQYSHQSCLVVSQFIVYNFSIVESGLRCTLIPSKSLSYSVRG